MIKRTLLLVVCVVLHTATFSQTWKNPMVLDQEWASYGIGDPYVLKHRGVFYLYCSTKDAETGIKCWSSKELANWQYEGLCSTDPITKGAYAPEVVYWNGMFYMYTSPAGKGHYVLSSHSPKGPFTTISSNFGKWIDGSVFIDDDASWYFYHASPSGVLGSTMDTPSSFGESLNLNAQMNGSWTEGPSVFKRDGKYYMIYTGNHLISLGYRIDYGTNISGPIDPFTPASEQNPILLNTMGYHVGLGHGSVFIGPDLDSYYLTYHNLVSRHGPFRHLNFDRIAWNGDKMMLLGSTDFEQQGAALPDAYDYFDRADIGVEWSFTGDALWRIENSEYLTQDSTIEGSGNLFKALLDSVSEPDYTAEFNFKETFRNSPVASLGAVFSYMDEENYGIAVINSYSRILEVNFLVNNVWGTPLTVEMPVELDYSEWHTIRIEKFENQYKFYVDGMFKVSSSSGLKGGKVGYITIDSHGDFGFIAFSNMVNGSGLFDIYKPVPGTIDAVLYNRGGEGVGYYEESPDIQADKILRSDESEIVECSRGGFAIRSVKANDWFKYNINVELDRNYNCEVIYSSESTSNEIRILLDDTDISGVIDLPSTGGIGHWRSFVVKDLQLPGGYHTLTIKAVSGDFNFYSIQFVVADNKAFDITDEFDGFYGMKWKYYDGDWSIKDNEAVINGFGKRTFGSSSWRDYTVETDIQFNRSMNAGLIFRTNNPALGGAGDDPAQGTDFLQGYFVGFNFNNIVLGKHNYGWQSLASAPGSYSMNRWYHLRAIVVNDNIRVYVDDMENPVINYTDTVPLINGMAGYRSFNTEARFDNFHVTSDTLTTSVRRRGGGSDMKNTMTLYPNPAAEFVSVDFTGIRPREVRILDMNGKEIYYKQTQSDHLVIPVKSLNPGLFIIQVLEKDMVQSEKLILK